MHTRKKDTVREIEEDTKKTTNSETSSTNTSTLTHLARILTVNPCARFGPFDLNNIYFTKAHTTCYLQTTRICVPEKKQVF